MLRFLVLVVLFRLSECRVRLAGGSSSSEGRVEIFHNGRWGTICDDNWDIDDARVVCRSLGLPDAIGATTLANFGQGSGEILLDEVQCRGNELSLSDCRRDGWGENNCGHGEDAGVVCGHPDVVNINVSSLSGVIRSPGYPQHMQRANYEWTFRPPIPNPNVIVCFDDLDLRTYSDGSFRATVQDSSNTELFFLKNSKHKGVCVIIESAGGKVIFYASLTPPKDDRGRGFRMRYAAIDRSQAEGFCSNGWDVSAKGEAGRIDLSWKTPPKQSKSGYKYIVVYNSSASNVRANLASSTSVVIDNLNPSREYSIRVIAIPLTNEQSSVLYSCTKRIRTKKEQSRVTDGKSASEGYVQVYHAGQWTRVCGNYWWDINDANVACRSMGLVAAKHAMVTYPKITKKGQHILLGNSISKLWLSGLRCTGREKSLLGCRTIASLGWTKFCYNDAGLVCKTRRAPQVERRNITDQAGFIISPGYPYSMIQAHHEWTFIPANQNTKVLMEFLHVDLKTKSGLTKLIVKNREGKTLLYAVDQNLPTSPAKRLVVDKFPINMTYVSSFTTDKEGKGMRMRYVFFDDSCSSNWSINVKPGNGKMNVSWTPQSSDSEYNYLIVYNSTFYKSDIVEILSPGATIDYLPPNTVYRVTILALHKNNTVTKHCTRYVRTKPETLRIGGGRIPNEGQVEIYSYNKWGVVCGYDWDMDDATVACRQAGFPPPTAVFGVGASPFATKKKQTYVLEALQCKGYETSLLECSTKKPKYDCKRANPAGVVCGRPKECKAVVKDRQGTIRSERYFSTREMDCQWTISAPSKTSLIILSLRTIHLSPLAICRKSSLFYIDSNGKTVQQICTSISNEFVMIGFAKIRLFVKRFFIPANMELDYFVSNDKLEDIVEVPNWYITAKSEKAGMIRITWPYYKPVVRDKYQNKKKILDFVPVCVRQKDGLVISPDSRGFHGDFFAIFKNLKYGDYTVYVMAYLGDSLDTPMTNWKEDARRSRNITLRTKQGRPLRAPINVTATTTGTNSILVTWEPIPEEYVNGILTGYTVYIDYYSPNRGKVTDTLGTSVYGRNNTSFKLAMAFSKTKYTFRVKGIAGGGSGPASSKVSATTGYEVWVTARYGHFLASNDSLYTSNTHKTWKLCPQKGRVDEIFIVFKTFDLESSHMCSNDYVKVTDEYDKKFGGRFCGKKSAFAVSVMSKRVAHVTFHSNAAIEKSGFSAFYKVIDQRLSKKSSVWNLQVQNASRTGAEVSWDIPDGNVSDIMVLFKESSVQYIWQAVKASPLDNSILLKELVPAKQYHVRLVGSIFDVIQESKLMTFTTMGGAKLDAEPK
ncbi:uncharacterized protein LOC116294384 [Actinia tenebrosa]|uniref:Uncharacterized protein LOC116294384 n=1 Tax=Actinia tenebrosa TaxID=6105 RepID=A0A6P8HZ09_ACTTE|nr:uncharacterized protein LOC116294384 [Actinia tenebrosa]